MAEISMRDKILDAAEKRARQGGYNAFSFREIAADVGIKSASVHYHFATKAALAKALAERYSIAALAKIGRPDTREEAVSRVAALFRDALILDRRMCLCGLFGAEIDALPEPVAAATRRFFDRMIDAIDNAPATAGGPALRGETVVAALEGALLLVRARGAPEGFDRIVSDLGCPSG